MKCRIKKKQPKPKLSAVLELTVEELTVIVDCVGNTNTVDSNRRTGIPRNVNEKLFDQTDRLLREFKAEVDATD